MPKSSDKLTTCLFALARVTSWPTQIIGDFDSIKAFAVASINSAFG